MFLSCARHISTPWLNLSLDFHLVPINVLVSNGSQTNIYLGNGFALRCFQRLSVPNLATRQCPWQVQPVHQRFVHLGPLVLEINFLNIQRPQQIGDRTVSRRSEPSSRTALIGEQPNPWDLLQPQDAMSRHRTLSILSYGADYIFFLFWIVAESRWIGTVTGMISVLCNKSRRITCASITGDKSSLSGQSLRGQCFLGHDFPRGCRVVVELLTGSPL